MKTNRGQIKYTVVFEDRVLYRHPKHKKAEAFLNRTVNNRDVKIVATKKPERIKKGWKRCITTF